MCRERPVERREIELTPAPDLALQGEVWLTELCFEIAFLGQDDAAPTARVIG
jgi:hypothetical protein